MNNSLNLFLKTLEKGVPFSYDWFEQKNTYRKKNSFMNDFTKDFAQALFNPDKINDLLRKELQQAVNNLLEAELTAFLGYDPYARNGWNTGNSRNGAYFRKVDTQFGPIEVQVPRDRNGQFNQHTLPDSVSVTHLRAHETGS